MEKIAVAILSLSSESCTDSFSRNITEKSPQLTCRFVKLTKSDFQSFKPQEKYDAIILLHSVLQGRNSITDVRGAKYDELLPLLRRTYGPSRVAVVVHSISGHNPGTKKALMMIFKQAQKTTFRCSNCIIQCNNPSEIPGEDMERLIEFLREVPGHALPVQEIGTSHLETNNKTEIKRKCVSGKSGDTLKPEPKTLFERSSDSFSAYSPRDKESSRDSGSNTGRETSDQGGSSPGSGCSLREPRIKHFSHKDYHSSEITVKSGKASPSKEINLANLTGLVISSYSSFSQQFERDITACFQGKLFLRIENTKMLRDCWSDLEAILVDVGDGRYICDKMKEFLMTLKSSKNTGLPSHSALLMSTKENEEDTLLGDILSVKDGLLGQSQKKRIKIFRYICRPGGEFKFDESTLQEIVAWFGNCYENMYKRNEPKPPLWLEWLMPR